MVILVSGLYFVAIHFAVLNGYKRSLKLEYRPFGPNMCRELYRGSNGSFIFTGDDLSCHRIPAEDFNRRNIGSFKVFCIVSMVRRSCCEYVKGLTTRTPMTLDSGCRQCGPKGNFKISAGRPPFLLHNSTTEGKNTTDLESVHCSSNITLHQACEEGIVCVMQYILSKGLADINSRDKLGRTPVMEGARKGHVAVFSFLLNQGCDLSVVDKNKDNVLHTACMSCNTDIVRILIANERYDMESKGKYGWTPVIRAVHHGCTEVFHLLVDRGCDLTVVDNYQNSILHVACRSDNIDIVKYILSREIIGINSKGRYGWTPIMATALKGHVRVIKYLISKGCNLKAVDDDNDNVFHWACLGGHIDVVKYILSMDIFGIDTRGMKGRTPVMMAAEKGHVEVVTFLISKNCDLKAVDDDKDNVFHWACLGGHVDMVKYILSKDIVGIDTRVTTGRTPVMLAAEKGHVEILTFLISKDCDLKAVDNDNDNVFHWACLGGHVDVVKYILSKDIVGIDTRGMKGRTPVMMAAEKGHVEVLTFLISKDCDLKAVDDDNDNVLHWACLGGHVDMVKYVLSKKILGINCKGKYGRTPVMMAAEKGRLGVLKFLMSKGCNIRAQDDSRNNILHVSCIGGHVNIVKYLITMRVFDKKQKNKQGLTPENIAMLGGHSRVAALFKESI